MTLREGLRVRRQPGGNTFVRPGASLSLDHVRVTHGLGGRGAGIASLGAQRFEIANSLIDQNLADPSASRRRRRNLIDGADRRQHRRCRYGTRRSRSNAAVSSRAAASRSQQRERARWSFEGVTIAATRRRQRPRRRPVREHAGAAAASPGRSSPGTLGANNVADQLRGHASPSTMAATSSRAPTAGSSRREPPEHRSAALGRRSSTPAARRRLLPLAPTSPAIDIATCCPLTDQRDLARAPGRPLRRRRIRARAGAAPAAGRAVQPLVLPPPRQLVPVARQHVIGVTASGKVLVRLPGTKRFVPLSQVRSLPLGTVVNATAGKIRITVRRRRQRQHPDRRLLRRHLQDRRDRARQTPDHRARALRQRAALPESRKRKPNARARAGRAKSRRLWGDGKGRFQTKGQYSSATVRGTKWLVQDSCKGTLTKVARGSVTVRDFVKRQKRDRQSRPQYLAKPRRSAFVPLPHSGLAKPRRVAYAGAMRRGGPRRLARVATLALIAVLAVGGGMALAAQGDIVTVAGTGTAGFNGDGIPAATAQISTPTGVTAMADGGYLITDQGNSRVRRVFPSGVITTVAGAERRASAATAARRRARRDAPNGTAVAPRRLDPDRRLQQQPRPQSRPRRHDHHRGGDRRRPRSAATAAPRPPRRSASRRTSRRAPDGSYLIADTDNNRIRQVSPIGIITTVAGTGAAGLRRRRRPATRRSCSTPPASRSPPTAAS